jgi:hypothetical protein
MNIGDKLNPISLGHDAIDLKSLLQSAGYIMPQGSVAKLPRIPGEVEAQIAVLETDREQYITLEEPCSFICAYCGDGNSTLWRKEVYTGAEFSVCGTCHKVAEVR